MNDGSEGGAPKERKPRPPHNRITPRQLKFVQEYMRTGSGAEAAKLAGYKSRFAAQKARKLLDDCEPVKAMVELARKNVQIKAEYGMMAAMKEAEDAITFSIKTENANAYVKAVELRAKLNGLLIERHDTRQVGFHLHVSGLDEQKVEGNIVDSVFKKKEEEEDDPTGQGST